MVVSADVFIVALVLIDYSKILELLKILDDDVDGVVDSF